MNNLYTIHHRTPKIINNPDRKIPLSKRVNPALGAVIPGSLPLNIDVSNQKCQYKKR